jgi:hypothetical protein
MTTKIIEIIITPDGQTKLETKGFSGPSCRDASKFLELALGQRSGETLTAEFHQQGQTNNQIQQET